MDNEYKEPPWSAKAAGTRMFGLAWLNAAGTVFGLVWLRNAGTSVFLGWFIECGDDLVVCNH